MERPQQQPWPYEAKQHIVQALILPTALYGCEIAPTSSTSMAKLAVTVARCVGTQNSSSSNIASTIMAAPTKSLLPTAQVLLRRCTLLRRMLAKHTMLLPIAKENIMHYVRCGLKGATTSEVVDQPCEQWEPCLLMAVATEAHGSSPKLLSMALWACCVNHSLRTARASTSSSLYMPRGDHFRPASLPLPVPQEARACGINQSLLRCHRCCTHRL